MCTFEKGNLKKLFYEQLANIQFTIERGVLRRFSGKQAFSLCDVCDGIDAASEEDVFYIPLDFELHGATISRHCSFSIKERQDILERFRTQFEANIKAQYGYSPKQGHDYEEFAHKLEKDLLLALKQRRYQ